MENHNIIKESDVNWEDLKEIGICKEELKRNGDLQRLLNGEEVSVIPLHLILLGIEIVMDATIRIDTEGNVPMLEISGIKPEDEFLMY